MPEPILSQPVRNSLLALQNTIRLLEQSHQRLATGKRVNSALDGPAAFFTAGALDSRAAQLERLIGSMDLAQRTIEAADNGAEAILKLLNTGVATTRALLSLPGVSVIPGTAEILGTTPIAADAAAMMTGTNAIAADVAVQIVGSGATLQPDAVAQTSSNGIDYGLTGLVLGLGGLLGQSITVNGNIYNFTLFSTGQDLQQFIDGIGGLSAEVTGGQLVITGDDATVSIDISFSSALVGLLTGLSEDVTDPVNLLTQGAAASGETLVIRIGANPALAITFGTDAGAGEISTLAQLDARLGTLAGGAASVDTGNGNISVQAGSNGDDIAISGTAALANFGIAAGTYEPANATLGGLAGVFTVDYGSESDSILFGGDDGAGEVSTRAELEARLAVLTGSGDTGIAFSINGGGQIMLDAPDASAGIVVGGDAGVLAALGFSSGQTASPSNATLVPLAAAGDTLVVTTALGTDTLVFGNDGGAGEISTRLQLEAAIAAPLANSGAAVAITGGGLLRITGPAGEDLTIGGAAAAAFGLAASASAPQAVEEASMARAEAQALYNGLLEQIDAIARDSRLNGVNLLQLDDLRVALNEHATSQLTVTGTDLDSQGLGLAAAPGDEFQFAANVVLALEALDAAIATVRARQAALHDKLSIIAIRRRFTGRLTAILKTGAAGLTLSDTDAEGAGMLALQTRLGLGSSSLALAAAADRGVLRLFV